MRMFSRSALAAVVSAAAILVGTTALPAWADDAPDTSAALKAAAAVPPDQRLAFLKQQAAREGELVIYSAIGQDRMDIWLNGFIADNPGIKLQYIRMTTNELAQKVLAEFKAGRTNADIIMSSSDWIGLLKGTLAAYEPTTWNDLDARFRHGGMGEGWTAVDFDSLVEVIAWRTDRISTADAPKTLDALMDPKWKGRAATVKVREPFLDAMQSIYGEQAAAEKVAKLAALDNRIYPSIAALSEAIGTGEADLVWGLSGARAATLKNAGRPVDFVVQQPPMSLNETMAIDKLAKHPYASALLEEFATAKTTLEASDKREPGRVFGLKTGSFTIPLTNDLFVYRDLPTARYRELNRTVEQSFVRH